jgi:hypothetical protein
MAGIPRSASDIAAQRRQRGPVAKSVGAHFGRHVPGVKGVRRADRSAVANSTRLLAALPSP